MLRGRFIVVWVSIAVIVVAVWLCVDVSWRLSHNWLVVLLAPELAVARTSSTSWHLHIRQRGGRCPLRIVSASTCPCRTMPHVLLT